MMDNFIIKYFTKDISEDELKKLIGWINENKENEKIFFDLKNIYDAKNPQPNINEIDTLWDKIHQDINSSQYLKIDYHKKYRRLKHILTYAASIIILFSTFYIFNNLQNQNKNIDTTLFSEISIPEQNSTTQLVLSDGTIVKLKSNTKFKYPTRFGSNTREVFLDGEAFFDVAKDDQKTFIVNTNSQTIKVQGTSFNVKDYRSEKFSNFTLIEGKVKLKTQGENYSLIPNQQVTIDKVYNTSKLYTISEELSAVFKSKRYHFKEKSLLQIFNDIEILYGVTITLQNSTIDASKYTGTFSLDQNITEIMETINYKKQFRYIIKDKQNITIT